MPKTMFSNGFEVGHTKEAFCLIFKFQNPDGNIVETTYVVISPSGTKTLIQLLQAEMEDYEKEHGQVETWKPTGNPTPNSQSYNSKKYVA